MSVGRRIVPAVPPLAGIDLKDPRDVEKLQESLRALQDFLEVVRDALDDGTPAGAATGAAGLPTTVDGTTAADAGSLETWSRSDHQHDADVTGTPGGVAATSAQGSGSGLARTDHSHRLTLMSVKGDLAGHNGTDPIRVAVGATDGHVLTVDASAAAGVSYQSVNDAFDPADENVVLCQQIFGRW